MSSYIVDLTIVGDAINEEGLSRQLGLEATRFFKKGEEKAPGVVWKESVWSLEALPADGNEWLSLEDGLMSILKKLMPAKEHLKRVAAEHDVTIRCGHFYSTFGGGPTLSAKLLEMLAELGIKIRVSNYWRDES